MFDIFAQQSVSGDGLNICFELCLVGKFAVLKQVGHFEECCVLGELLYGISAVSEDSLLTVDV